MALANIGHGRVLRLFYDQTFSRVFLDAYDVLGTSNFHCFFHSYGQFACISVCP